MVGAWMVKDGGVLMIVVLWGSDTASDSPWRKLQSLCPPERENKVPAMMPGTPEHEVPATTPGTPMEDARKTVPTPHAAACLSRPTA